MKHLKTFRRFGLVLTGYSLLVASATQAAQVDIEFSEFTAGQTFPNTTLPRTITSDDIDVELSKYQNSLNASGRIVDAQLFGMPNNVLFLAANLRAEVILPAPSTGGFFFFRNQGGTNLLEINGELMNFTNAALAGSAFGTLGGVDIHSSTLTGSYRSVKLEGVIHTLAFIGQELNIDSVQLVIVPEPTGLCILFLASFGCLGRNAVPKCL